MDHPREFILRDVRCFEGEQRGRLRPITLLVGENSTGKTTFLGCYRVLHRVFSGRSFDPLAGLLDRAPDFNEEPFTMGSFRDIVRSRLGPKGRIDEFKLGLDVQEPDSGMPPYELIAAFSEQGSQPVVSALRFQFDADSFLQLRQVAENTLLEMPGNATEVSEVPLDQMGVLLNYPELISGDRKSRSSVVQKLAPVRSYLNDLAKPRRSGRSSVGGKQARAIRLPFHVGGPNLSQLIPVAPLRSKPKRTYDPVRETASPEGEHTPMLMMRLDRTDKRHWDSLHSELVAFGRDSGLFSDIKVKSHGKQMSDPFQLQVKARSGPHANIMDVGYGVSQSLPILVDIMTEEPARGRRRNGGDERTFLLQQPEVHLHPRGQAQLANLFMEAFRKRGSRFLIETHSDYIVDRVRIAVRQGRLKPDDVSILYFEPNGRAAKIHNMSLDEHGNLLDAPPGYRDFFAKETDRLLGFAD